MVEHKQLPVTLDSYDLDEVYAEFDGARQPSKVVRITIHGKNLVSRALEPLVRIGHVLVQHADTTADERRIIGFLTELPKEGAPITLEYGGQAVALLKEPFTLRKLKRL